jgi:alkylation response protein AidB-like acyl-CoA dehydrogenase
MNFGFTEDQEALRDATRKFLDNECPTTFVRKMMADDTAHATELWKKIAQLGWLGIIVPEDFGGSGGSFLDLVVILEEAGKSLLPGPFFATALLGTTTVLAGGSASQKEAILPKIVEGNHIVTLALAEKSGRYDAAGVTLAARQKAMTSCFRVRRCLCRTRMSLIRSLLPRAPVVVGKTASPCSSSTPKPLV